MANLYMLIGPPGVGKSTYAARLAAGGAVLLSSDAMRKRLFGNEDEQGRNTEVFDAMKAEMKAALGSGRDVIWDATCMTAWSRRENIAQAPPGTAVYGIVLTDTLENILSRNAKRERVVPEDVIRKMIGHYEPPMPDEGFSEIKVEAPEGWPDIGPEDAFSAEALDGFSKAAGRKASLIAEYADGPKPGDIQFT